MGSGMVLYQPQKVCSLAAFRTQRLPNMTPWPPFGADRYSCRSNRGLSIAICLVVLVDIKRRRRMIHSLYKCFRKACLLYFIE